MERSLKARGGMVFAAAVAILFLALPRGAVAVDREVEFRNFSRYADEALPVVARMMGVGDARPVDIVMLTRSEVRDFLIDTVERDYPEGELEKRGECLAALGLLPAGYDLRAGMIDVVGDEAGAFYDPHSDNMKGIVDLPPTLRNSAVQKMIVSHELTHALQDRVIDIAAEATASLSDMDREYCLRAVLEGMASNVMLAYMNDLPLDEAPDVEATLRAGFEQRRADTDGSLARCPLYLRESLLSPYVDGGGFVQKWLDDNPDRRMVELLQNWPASSEQVLHYDKFEKGDVPAPVCLSIAMTRAPADWEIFYANTLGEFDVRMLFLSHDETARDAVDMAAGWDGLKFQAYRDGAGRLIVIGASVWDSEKDAKEFLRGMRAVLGKIYGEREYGVRRDGARVGFIAGATEEEAAGAMLAGLVEDWSEPALP
jgi:hypothetical protein